MKQFCTKFTSLAIVLLPILQPYAIFGVNLSIIALFLLVVLSFITFHRRPKFKYNSQSFFIYAMLIPNLVALSSGYFVHIKSSIIVVLMYVLGQIFVFPTLKGELVLQFYKKIVYVICIFFVIQEISYFILGFRPSGIIPFLPIMYEGGNTASFITYQMFFERSSTFFLEPSHMAEYLLPYLALSLGSNSSGLNVRKYIEPILISLVLIFLKSGCGILGAGMIWTFYILQIKMSKGKKIFFIFFSIVLALVIFEQIQSTQLVQDLMNRTTELEISEDNERSGGIRFSRGYFVFSDLNFIHQLLGVGTGGAIDAIENSRYLFMFFGNERYLNNVHTLLIGFGIIGTFLFVLHIITLYRKNFLAAKLILIGLIALSLLENFFLTPKMILYIVLVFLLKDEYQKRIAKVSS